jgi:hypothetical protein
MSAGSAFDEVRLVSSHAVAKKVRLSTRHAATLLEAGLLGTVYVAEGARYVAAPAVEELAARPVLPPFHPPALVLRVGSAVEEDPAKTGRTWKGWGEDLPLDVRRTAVAWYWQMTDEAAQRVVDQEMPIVVTVRGFVVDVFAAADFHRAPLGVAFHPRDIDGTPFAGTVLRLGPGGTIVWLEANRGGAWP